MLVVSNAILIPSFGIIGCAMASTFSRLVYNFLCWFFLYRKFKLQPFDRTYLYLIGITIVSYFVAYLIPNLSNFIVDIIVRSTVLVMIFGLGVYFTHLSTDLNETFQNILKQLKLIK